MNVQFIPALFPPVAYMAAWIDSEHQWNSETVYFKSWWLNRYRILGPNGVQDISAPVVKNSLKGAIKNVRLDHQSSWTEKEWRAIRTAYSNASFYEALEHELQPIITRKHQFLMDRIEEGMNWVSSQLNISPPQDVATGDTWRGNWGPKDSPQSISYRQVFQIRHGFQPNLSILDLLMNEGPLSQDILHQQKQLGPFNPSPSN